MFISGAETRKCPKEFQDRITRAFGKNHFGDPLFKIVWSQSEFIRMGNVWRDKHGNERRGYIERYMCPTPCWMIMKWKSPSEYGTPELFYMNTYDEFSKLHVTGEYPWRGRYEVVQPLYTKEFVDGKLKVESFPLSHILIDKIIPLMVRAQYITKFEREAAQALIRKQEAEKRQKEVDEIAERMMDTMPTYLGPVSYSKQGIRTSVLDRKMHQLEQAWTRMAKSGRQLKKGFFQGNSPN